MVAWVCPLRNNGNGWRETEGGNGLCVKSMPYQSNKEYLSLKADWNPLHASFISTILPDPGVMITIFKHSPLCCGFAGRKGQCCDRYIPVFIANTQTPSCVVGSGGSDGQNSDESLHFRCAFRFKPVQDSIRILTFTRPPLIPFDFTGRFTPIPC